MTGKFVLTRLTNGKEVGWITSPGVYVWAWNPADSTPEGQFPEALLRGTNEVLCRWNSQWHWGLPSSFWYAAGKSRLCERSTLSRGGSLSRYSLSSPSPPALPPCSSFFLFFQKCYSGLRQGRKTGKPGGLRRERNLSGKSLAGLEAMILPQRTVLVPNVANRKNILPTLKYWWIRPRPEWRLDLFLPEDMSWAPFRALKRIASIPHTNPASEGIRKVRLTLSENAQRALGLFMGVFLSLKPLLKNFIEPQLCYTLASPKILFSQSHKSQFSLSPRP